METQPDQLSDDRLQSRLKPGDDDILVVVFSQVRVPAGKFGLERLFSRTRHSCLFLNDTQFGWYLGLDTAIDAKIAEALSRTKAGRIIYYGSSMGGYGALMTGLLRQDGAIHAFGTELRAGYPGTQSSDHGIRSDDPRLFTFDDAPLPDFPVHLYFGILDPVDAVNAVTADHALPSARLHLLRSCHASHDHLYSINVIRRIISTFSRDPKTELASKNLIATTDLTTLKQFGSLAERLVEKKPVAPAEVLELEGYSENPGMMRLAANAHAMAGDITEALATLEQAETLVQTDPVLRTLPKRWRRTLPMRRVELLMTRGDRQGAKEVLSWIADTFPINERMVELASALGMELTPVAIAPPAV